MALQHTFIYLGVALLTYYDFKGKTKIPAWASDGFLALSILLTIALFFISGLQPDWILTAVVLAYIAGLFLLGKFLYKQELLGVADAEVFLALVLLWPMGFLVGILFAYITLTCIQFLEFVLRRKQIKRPFMPFILMGLTVHAILFFPITLLPPMLSGLALFAGLVFLLAMLSEVWGYRPEEVIL